MPQYKSYNVDAPGWHGPFLRPCHISMGILKKDSPSDDLTRAALAGGGGWIYVLKGRFLVKESDREIWIDENQSFLFTNPTHAVLCHPESVSQLRVGLYGAESASILEQVIEHHGSYHQWPHGTSLIETTEALLRQAQRKRIRPAHEWSTRYYAWLMQLCQSLENDAVTLEDGRKVMRNSRLLGSVHPSFKSYAKAMGYHPAYLSRTIKKSWGIKSPANLIRKHRLQEAEHLLRTTNLSIREVSQRVCYANPESFSTAFRRQYHVPPLEYRHQSRMQMDE